MGCTSASTDSCTPKKRKTLNLSTLSKYLVNEQEYEILSLIYSDISQRNIYKQIGFLDFSEIFAKYGIWGEQLFDFFDCTSSHSLSKEEFIFALGNTTHYTAVLSKSSTSDKARLILSGLSVGDNFTQC